VFTAIGIASALVASPAWAQDTTNYVPAGEIKQTETAPTGLDGALSIAANLALSQNDAVAGQVDGVSLLMGLSILGGVDYLDGPHEWRNTLQLTGAWARTPAVDEFLKTNDLFGVESLYNYFIIDWFGVFGRVAFASSMLPAEDVRSDEHFYSIKRKASATPEVTPKQKRLELASPFQPATLSESLGLFVEPYRSPEVSVSFRAGIGARETFADGVLVIRDDDATLDTIEVEETADVYQGGAEAFLGVSGKLFEKRVTYLIGGAVMFPILNNDDQDRSIIDLTYVGANAAMSLALVEWMSVNYQFRAIYDPQLIGDVQIQNNLLLTFKYDFIQRREPPPPPPKVDKEKEALKKQLQDALDANKALEKKLGGDEPAKDAPKTETPPAAEPAKAEPAKAEPAAAEPAKTDGAEAKPE